MYCPVRIAIRKLHTLRERTRPSDDFLFSDDLQGFLDFEPENRAKNYYMRWTKLIIRDNLAAAAKAAFNETKTKSEMFKPLKQGGLKRIQKWGRNKLMYDAFSKEKE